MPASLLGLSRPVAVAHRAGDALARLRAAEEAGADVIEADLWRRRGRLEVRHLKTIGPIPIFWDRWYLASLRTPRLLLSELVAAASPETLLMLDLKGWNNRLGPAVQREMARIAPGRPYAVCAQRWAMLEPFHAVPEAIVVHSIGKASRVAEVMAHISRPGHAAVSIDQKLLTPEVVRGLREHADVVMSWPVNDEATLDRLYAWGVNGFITDSLEIVRAVSGLQPRG
jgi:glycerophosphoryl diester phosphodiesterase